MMNSLLLAGLILLFVERSFGSVNRVKIWYGDKNLPVDIALDWTTNTSIVDYPHSEIIDGVPSIPTLNLHDYNKGLLVFKDIKNGQCLIKQMVESMKDVYDMIQRIKQGYQHSPQQELVKRNSTKLSNSEVMTKAGNKIYEYCLDYDTYWLVPAIEKAKTVRMPQVSKGFCCFIKDRRSSPQQYQTPLHKKH